MLQSHNFGNQSQVRIGILVKDKAFKPKEIKKHYVDYLESKGLSADNMTAWSLPYKDDKAPVSWIKEQLVWLGKALAAVGTTHLIVTDSAWFKVLCKVRKAEPHYGYLLPTILPGVQASLSLNYNQLFYNPTLVSFMRMGLDAVANDFNGIKQRFDGRITGKQEFHTDCADPAAILKPLLDYPALTCDIETEGLHINESHILSIAFGFNKTDGLALYSRPDYTAFCNALRDFFRQYKGKLIFHNAAFDVRCIIKQVFMKSLGDSAGMLEGLHLMFRDLEDTKLLAYLHTNTTSGNDLGLKSLAFEYVGNYAIDDIKNAASVDPRALLEYNLLDTLATWFVYEKYSEPVKQHSEALYRDLMIPSQKVLVQTELSGMPLNNKQVHLCHKELKELSTSIVDSLHADPLIKNFTYQLKLEAAISATAKLKKTVKVADDFPDLMFNPNSGPQVSKLLYEVLGLPIQHYTDTGTPSTDARALDGLIAYIDSQLAELE